MKKLHYQFHLVQAIRNFFCNEGFMDVITPPIVENPGMEVHIHPFEVMSAKNKNNKHGYLHTSPEFNMKRILAESSNLNDIFTIGYSFRDEPKSKIHRHQFLMCEWYRKNEFYTKIMDDVESLIKYSSNYLKSKGIETFEIDYPFTRVSIEDLFLNTVNFNILDFENKDDLKRKIELDFKDVPLPDSSLNWDDYYFLLFLNKVEPIIEKYPYILLHSFPKQLAALSTINAEDPRVCDRFEVYMKGLEICNSFNELTNLQEQKNRFRLDSEMKRKLYNYELPEPERFYQSLELGLPNSSGIALGVERFLMALTGEEDIFFD